MPTESERDSQSLLHAHLGVGFSVLMHLIALVSFSTASGLASTFVLFFEFWTGCIIGLIIYGTILGVSWLAEDDG